MTSQAPLPKTQTKASGASDIQTKPAYRHLLMIAGPGGAGKKTLLKQMQEGEHPGLCVALDISSLHRYHKLAPGELLCGSQQKQPYALTAYDFLLAHHNQADFSHVQKLVRSAERVTIVTLRVSADELQRRNDARLRELWINIFTRPRLKRIRRLRRLWLNKRTYRRPEQLQMLYKKWDRTISECPNAKNVLLEIRENQTYEII